MKHWVIFYGLLTAIIVAGFVAMMFWNEPRGGSGDWTQGIWLAGYVVSPWVAAFIVAAHRPSRTRLRAMIAGSIVGAVLVGWEYYHALFHPTSSTSVLSLAVLPVYQWIALLGVYVLVKWKEGRPERDRATWS